MSSLQTKKIFMISHLVTGMLVYLFYASSFASRDQSEIIRGLILTPILLMAVGWLVFFKVSTNLNYTIVTVILSSFLWVLALGYFIESASSSRPFGQEFILSVKFALLAMLISSPILFVGAVVQFWLIKFMQKKHS